MGDIKKEIEAAAVAAITCPSCGARPGDRCMVIRSNPPFKMNSPCRTHQRRLSSYVAGNIREVRG